MQWDFWTRRRRQPSRPLRRHERGVEDVQLKRELGQAYGELGKQAFELVESGALSHSDLEPTVARIRGLNEKLAAADEPTPEESEAQDADEPATSA